MAKAVRGATRVMAALPYGGAGGLFGGAGATVGATARRQPVGERGGPTPQVKPWYFDLWNQDPRRHLEHPGLRRSPVGSYRNQGGPGRTQAMTPAEMRRMSAPKAVPVSSAVEPSNRRAGTSRAATINLTVNAGPLASGPEIGRRIVDALEEFYRSGGRPPLTVF